MAERRLEGLQRVLGVYPLASSAYGNVGSSIYYALGLVASLALGLTPIVFIISGFIFFLTASTYAEATAMYPGGGRLVELRAPGVQRVLVVLRRLGPDAQLHADDRHLGVLRPALHRRPVLVGTGPSARRRARRDPGDRRPGADQRPRSQGVDRGQPGAGGDRLLHPGADRAGRPGAGVLAPDAGQQRASSAWRPTWGNFFVAIPLCMLAYTGIETISNMSEEAKNPGKTVPEGDQPGGDRGVHDLRAAAGDRALGAAGATRWATTT